jgi:hypothetical protein
LRACAPGSAPALNKRALPMHHYVSSTGPNNTLGRHQGSCATSRRPRLGPFRAPSGLLRAGCTGTPEGVFRLASSNRRLLARNGPAAASTTCPLSGDERT